MASPRPSGFARSCPALFLRQVGRQRPEGWMGAGLLAPFARVAQRVEQGRRVADAVTSWWTVDTGRAELGGRTVRAPGSPPPPARGGPPPPPYLVPATLPPRA